MDANVVHGDLNANQSLIAADGMDDDGKGVNKEKGTTITTSLLPRDLNSGFLQRNNITAKDLASSLDGDDWPTTACMFMCRRTKGMDQSTGGDEEHSAKRGRRCVITEYQTWSDSVRQ
jgi:hypothetical protein